MSNEKKYTPGPWEVFDMGWSGSVAVAKPLSNGAKFLVVEAVSRDLEANARLIAAAPELLEALEDLLAGWELMIGQYGYDPGEEPEDSLNMKARAAIAKALGE